MRAVGPILAAVAVLLQNADTAQACGDKFLMVGRGVSFHHAYAAIYSASIIVYAPPQRGVAKAIRDPRFQSDLKLAGHRVLLVENDASTVNGASKDARNHHPRRRDIRRKLMGFNCLS